MIDADNGHVPDTMGSLAIYTVGDGAVWHGGVEHGDRYLGDFLGSDWDAIFYELFACPTPQPYGAGDNLTEYNESRRQSIQRCLSEYPMLARIWDLYLDVGYLAEDVRLLQIECQKLSSSTDQARTKQALAKLLQACSEAIRDNQALFLVSD